MQRRSFFCQSITGAPIPACSITVYLAGTLTKATIYSDQAGSTTLGNPITAGTDGTYTYYAANGRYTEVLSASGFTFGAAQTQDFILNDPFVAASPAAATGSLLNASAVCLNIPSPVAGSTWCFDTTLRGLKVYDGTRFATVTTVNTYSASVKDFGAKGDGTTDDTAAIQTAVNAGLGTIYFPPGTYEVTGTITITNGVRLIGLGAGPGGVLTIGAQAGYNGAVIEHNFNGDLFKITGVNGFVEQSVGTTFENLLLRQIAGNGTGAKGKAIYAVAGGDTFKPSWIRIKNVTTETGAGKDDWTWSVYLDGAATSSTAAHGLRDTWIENCRFNSGTNGAGELYGEAVANLFITSVEFNGTATNVQLTGADAGHASLGAYISNTTTNGSLVLTRATSVYVHGGAWTSITTTANTATSVIMPNFITNTPSAPVAGNLIAAYINALGRYAVFTASTDVVEYRTGITINGGAFASGTLAKTATAGLAIAGITGSPYDLTLYSVAGTPALVNPTGGASIQIPGSGLQIGAPTGGDAGVGTVNAQTSYLQQGTVIATMVLTNASGTRTNVPHMVQDTVTLAAGTAGVALAGAAAFTNSTSYTCVCDNDSAVLACRVVQNGGNGFTLTSGAGTDVVRFICIGS